MAIKPIYVAVCVECGDRLYGYDMNELHDRLVAQGWRIGNTDVCPRCIEKARVEDDLAIRGLTNWIVGGNGR